MTMMIAILASSPMNNNILFIMSVHDFCRLPL